MVMMEGGELDNQTNNEVAGPNSSTIKESVAIEEESHDTT